MTRFIRYINSLDDQQEEMTALVKTWSAMNSHSSNIEGLDLLRASLIKSFQNLQGTITEISLPSYESINDKGDVESRPTGKALSLIKRQDAPFKILLCGHMDTVYSKEDPFQKPTLINEHTLKGPGVADMKGGLVILLKTLEILDNSPFAENIGWEVLITPDEEIGSVSSYPYLAAAAKRNHIGLIFEPSLPDGALVSQRKSSANYTLVSKGIAAHAGRDFASGKNAINALCRIICEIEQIPKEIGTTVNVGYITGGGAVNVVPDFALCKVNVRTETLKERLTFEEALHTLIKDANCAGENLKVHLNYQRPAKPFDNKTEDLFNTLKTCGADLNTPVQWRPSGGVCDGNILASEGLATIDTLGGIGGHLHSSEEFLDLRSLTERAKLAALLIMKLGNRHE